MRCHLQRLPACCLTFAAAAKSLPKLGLGFCLYACACQAYSPQWHLTEDTCAVTDVQQALVKRAAGWQSIFPDTPAPGKDWLLVFVSNDMDAMLTAAAAATAAGYERTAVLEGGVQALTPGALQQVPICNLHL